MLVESQQRVLKVGEGFDAKRGDSHGSGDECDGCFVGGCKIIFEDIFFLCDGKKREDTASSIIDDAYQQGDFSRGELQEAADVVYRSEITNDQDCWVLGRDCPSSRGGNDTVDSRCPAIDSSANPRVFGACKSIEIANRHAVGDE